MRLNSLIIAAIIFFPAFAWANVADDSSSATVFAYFNISDDGGDSSLSFDQFSEQVDEIGIGNYTVLPLSDLLAKEKQNSVLPPNTIAITFDDPGTDTYSKAIPLLIENKIPFTVFISPGSTDDEEWSALNNLKEKNLVTIGLTSFTYGHQGNWSQERLAEDINNAKAVFREKLSLEPVYFSYPLGEYSANFVDVIRKSGFTAAFGQTSGVISKSLDQMKLPRFTMTDDFGDIERFRNASNALPLPVKDTQPDVTYMTSMPSIGFTIDDRIAIADMKKTKCFSSGTDQPRTSFLESGRVEVRFNNPPETDRLRINCTIPVPGELPDDDPQYRWLGFLMYFPVRDAPDGAAEEIETSPVQP